MSRRPAVLAAAALAAVGLVLAVLLAREHAVAHGGGTSFCTFGETLSCDRVALSRFSVALGLPVAVWGAFGYGLALLLALAGLSPRRAHEGWPAGLLLLLSAAATALDLALAVLSAVAIGALCPFCAGTWLVSLGLLAASWRACQPAGVAAMLRADLAVLRRRPAQAAVAGLAALALVFVVAAAYPRYWDAPRGAVSGTAAPGFATSGSTGGPLVVVEFSDYECPACARAHEETKALLAGRSDVQLSRRQFPLDSECNPALKRRMHPGSCELAKLGICAEAQGKIEPMEDLLYANQTAHRPVEELVRAAGLDVHKVRECLSSPETEARLRSDIEAGIRIGLRATPTFVVNGRAYPGALPPDVLPPRKAAQAARP